MDVERLASGLEQIGRYRITGELGRGGMGVVYRGEDRLIGREVAIKTLTEVTPELRERFYLEARSGILSHPNIVTVYELGEHEGSPFIAMEFIAGESLQKMLRVRKRLLLLEALSVVEQLCAGLGHAHGHGVVHRDVKPANVLVRPDGRVTIVDFGIARLADQTRQLTKTDALLGTFNYIAPERLKGEASDGRADVWSVGVMLYEMLTGVLPFKGKDVSSLYRVIHEPYVPLAEYVQDLPDGLSGVLDKALAKQVSDRYMTAEEMAFDLQVIAEMLKQERVSTLLSSVRKLAEEREFASARTVLLQAQRIDPGNLDAKMLMTDVQERLNELQRGEQLRQIVEQAQGALEDRRWDDAITFFQQAQMLDTDNVFGLNDQLQDAQEQKARQQRLIALWEEVSDARSRGDLTGAQELLGEALRIDSRSTDLRNAYSVVLREIKQKQQAAQVEDLLRTARQSYTLRQYTEAIGCLREAAGIDPAHAEVQELLFTVTTRQKEERRQHLLDKVVAEIQESLDKDDFALAQDRVTRALETLPGEGMLLRLKTETEAKKREFDRQETVRKAVLEAQDLFADDPVQALRVIEAGLQEVPDNETLLHSRTRLREHMRQLEADAAYSDVLVRAHAATDAGLYAEAKEIVEIAIATHGPSDELGYLLSAINADLADEENRREEKPTKGQGIREQAKANLQDPAEIRPVPDVSAAHVKQVTGRRTGKLHYAYAGAGVIATATLLATGFMHLHHKEVSVKKVAFEAATPVPELAGKPKMDTEMEMVIGASPWAKILDVRDEDGRSIALPAGVQTTPLRLDGLKPGPYKVMLGGPGGKQKTIECKLSAIGRLCTAEMSVPDMQQLLSGEQP
jgi:serine/threonine-protein kinase